MEGSVDGGGERGGVEAYAAGMTKSPAIITVKIMPVKYLPLSIGLSTTRFGSMQTDNIILLRIIAF